MRLFFALWPDTDTAARLADVGEGLDVQVPGRRVHPKNHHVTLAFLGEVPDSQVAMFEWAGGSVQATRFTLAFDSLEYWAQSRVIVAATRESPPQLLRLAAQLHAASGLPPQGLRAHVTLARKMAQAPVLQAISPIRWDAVSFSLVRSDTGGAESAYTVVHTWPLLYET